MEHWSIEDYKNYEEGKKPKKAKYRSYKTSVDGHTFDSLKEAELLAVFVEESAKTQFVTFMLNSAEDI